MAGVLQLQWQLVASLAGTDVAAGGFTLLGEGLECV